MSLNLSNVHFFPVLFCVNFRIWYFRLQDCEDLYFNLLGYENLQFVRYRS